MKTQLHNFTEQVADCIIALIAWREADRERLSNPNPESRHWERECYKVLDQFPDSVQTEAQIIISKRAA